jgi:hypothetical protein
MGCMVLEILGCWSSCVVGLTVLSRPNVYLALLNVFCVLENLVLRNEFEQ